MHRKQNRKLIIAAVIIGAMVIAGIAYVVLQDSSTSSPVAQPGLISSPSTPPATPFTPAAPVSVDADGTATMASGLKYKDIVEGTGESPRPGRLVTVHYTGTFPNGKKFDSSVDRGQPYQFIIGKGKVIDGWDEGVMSMKVGGRRKLIVPPDLAYGRNGFEDSIPPNATLLFDIELLGVK